MPNPKGGINEVPFTTYLIAHQNKGGGGISQAQVTARNEDEAKAMFAERYPERVITTIGVRPKL